MHKNKKFILGAIASLLLILFIPVVQAFPPPNRNTCDEGIHPYDNTLQKSTDNSAISHKLGNDCTNDMIQPFPNQHIQPVDPNTHNPAKTGLNVKGLKHNHRYYNDSDQDDGTNNYYYAYIAKFEITLEEDFMKNVDLGTLKCAVPVDGINPYNADFEDCNGYDAETFGGTKVERNGNTVTYTFGINHGWDKNNGKAGKPIIPGKNQDIDQGVYFAKDTTLEQNRMFEARVDADSLDKTPLTIWSATTTSRALVKHIAIQQSAFATGKNHACGEPGYNATNAWCNAPVTGYPLEPGYTDYHWFPIGTVSTVWKKPTTPPPSSMCTGLTITNPTAPILKETTSPLQVPKTYEMTPNTETTFSVLPSFSNGEVPLDYRWEAMPLTFPMSATTGSVNQMGNAIATKSADGQASVLMAAIPELSNTSSSLSEGLLNSDAYTSILKTYGFFADDNSKKDIANPYVDKNNGPFIWVDDRKTYYTGGPAGTLIRVFGVDPTNEQYVGNDCMATIVIPPAQDENTCVDLEIKPTSLEEKTAETFTVIPKFAKTSPPIELDYLWSTKQGNSLTPGYKSFDFIEASNMVDLLKKADSTTEESSIPDLLKPSADGTSLEMHKDTTLPDKLKKPEINYEEVKVPVPQPEPDPIDEFKNFNTLNTKDMQTNLLAAAPIPTISDSINQHGLTAKPEMEGIVPIFFNKFADSSTTNDFANPYKETETMLQPDDRSTYYTGGNAGTVISVQAYNKQTGDFYPLCKANVTIQPSPPDDGGDKCLDAEIVQGQVTPIAVPDEVQLADPIEGLWVRVNTDPQEYEADLAFDWEVTGGGELFATSSNFGTRVSTTNFADTVNLTDAVDGTRVTVAAVDPENKLENIEICKDEFVVKASPTMMCQDLRLSPTKPVFGPGLSTYLSASPLNTDGSPVLNVKWYESGDGYFTPGPVSLQSLMFPTQPCPVPTQNSAGITEFDATAKCDYFYNAGANGGGTIRIEAKPNIGGSSNCLFQATVPGIPGGKPVICETLTFDNSTLNKGLNIITGEVTFSDNKTREVNITWNGTEANILGPNPEATTGGAFSQSVSVNNNTNSSVNARVTSLVTPDPLVTSLTQCTDTMTLGPETEECKNPRFNYNRKPGYVCFDVDDYTGEYVWVIEGTTLPNNGDCIRTTDFNNDDYDVYAEAARTNCELENQPDITKKPPSFNKLVRQATSSSGYKSVQTASLDPNNPTEFMYKLEFISNSDGTSADITDPDMKSGITGQLLPAQYSNLYTPGTLSYISGSTRVENNLPVCNEEEDEENWTNCYQPYPPDIRDGIKLYRLDNNTKVTITYRAKIEDSPIMDPNICREGKVCEEIYENRAGANWKIIGSSQQVLANGQLWDEARIQAFCQYILTRAAGDIFLETDLSYGVDINKCSEFTTSTGVIVTPGLPDAPPIVSSGAGGTATIEAISHEICSEGQAGTLDPALKDFYGQGVSDLSSQICEVKLQTGSPWKQEIIANSIEENKLRLSRWGADYNYDVTLDSTLPDQDVTYISGDLTVPTQGYTLDKGAKTFIIEGDLIIRGDIKYSVPQGGYATVRDTASLAFIVLGGDIKISNDVKDISGVFYVQEDKNGNGGQLSSLEDKATYNKLAVWGSIYGDIEPLFKYRLFAGDPSLDEGGIVIRFDQRILLNTPPGLRDVLDVSQTEVAR